MLRECAECPYSHVGNRRTYQPVSYTHLDVYKRQEERERERERLSVCGALERTGEQLTNEQ